MSDCITSIRLLLAGERDAYIKLHTLGHELTDEMLEAARSTSTHVEYCRLNCSARFDKMMA